MLTFEPTVAMIATIVLPCAAIIFGMVALVRVVVVGFAAPCSWQ